MASKTSGGTAFLGTTPWITPEPSRNWGKRVCRFAEVVEPSADDDGLAFVGTDLCDAANGDDIGIFYRRDAEKSKFLLSSQEVRAGLGPQFSGRAKQQQVLRFAQDDNLNR